MNFVLKLRVVSYNFKLAKLSFSITVNCKNYIKGKVITSLVKILEN